MRMLKKALREIGATELAKSIGRAGGHIVLEEIAGLIGIDLTDPNVEFDQIAADWTYRNREQVQEFQLQLLGVEVKDRQHARTLNRGSEHRYLIAFIVGGCMLSVVGTLGVLLVTPIVKPAVIYPDAQMILISSIVSFLMGSGVGVFLQYVFGTSRSSASKNDPIFDALAQAQKSTSTSKPVVRQKLPVRRPVMEDAEFEHSIESVMGEQLPLNRPTSDKLF